MSIPRAGFFEIPMDTSQEASRIQVELLRKMSPHDRARLASDITRAVEELCLAGIRLRHPQASERECFLRLALIKLGPDLTRKAYPEAAPILGLRP